MLIFSFRENDCLLFVLKPCSKLFEFDGVRPENLNFEGAITFDEEMRGLMNDLQIPFVRITKEDLQERIDFVKQEMLKLWPDLKLVP